VTRCAALAVLVLGFGGAGCGAASDGERRPEALREPRPGGDRAPAGGAGGAGGARAQAIPADAAPKPEAAPPRPGDLVDVSAVIPDAVLDLRYATANNFTGAILYPKAVCKLRRAVASRLADAAAALRAQGRRLLLWDCYRPSSIQEKFWKLVPDPRYVANPKVGSRHSRGAAVDLALVDADGRPLVLPTKFDEFTEAAHRGRALAGPSGAEARKLEEAMLAAGFRAMPTEWWHFDAPDSGDYALSNEPL
jgi:D-alanyl-D-alanine dipeptidase